MIRRMLNLREPLFYRPPAQAALRIRARIRPGEHRPHMENTERLPVDRPYFLVVESENEILFLLDAMAQAVPFRATAFWMPQNRSGIREWAFSLLANGMRISDDADELAALMTPRLQRSPTWAELRAAMAALSGKDADETVLNAPQIQAFFEALGGREAARLAFDRARARALEEIVRIHRKVLIQKNCAVIVPWKRDSLLGDEASPPAWIPVAHAVGERVFPVAHRTEATGKSRLAFTVLPALGDPPDAGEPEWAKAARELWNRIASRR